MVLIRDHEREERNFLNTGFILTIKSMPESVKETMLNLLDSEGWSTSDRYRYQYIIGLCNQVIYGEDDDT